MKLKYFGKQIAGKWVEEQGPETITHFDYKLTYKRNKDGSRVLEPMTLQDGTKTKPLPVVLDREEIKTYSTTTQTDFVFKTDDHQTILVERSLYPKRKDPPIEIHGMTENGKRLNGPDICGYTMAIYENSPKREIVQIRKTTSLPEQANQMEIPPATVTELMQELEVLDRGMTRRIQPPDHTKVFRLYVKEGKTIQQIAGLFKCSSSLIKKRKLAIEAKLRNKLQHIRARQLSAGSPFQKQLEDQQDESQRKHSQKKTV